VGGGEKVKRVSGHQHSLVLQDLKGREYVSSKNNISCLEEKGRRSH